MIVATKGLTRILARLITVLILVAPAAATERKQEVLAWQAASEGGNYDVSLTPREQPIPVGSHHQWVIGLASTGGQIVTGARLRISGGMPGHGHGMPSQPLVTEEFQPGRYRVEGMQFNMHGPWRIVVGIDGQAGRDRADFSIIVGH